MVVVGGVVVMDCNTCMVVVKLYSLKVSLKFKVA